ncbi:aminotransferase class I/II-fold pyridoxal phosphate-dependent enzyme [Streptomyces sp. NPDC048281]|uniref:aminotransferase class I/II-fold pyridoxal phosphate-dependent enzyme n=1 Tax=Streptomyces sp. NPDC048281 TaxID=3154715 RepID=UPI003443F7D8
MPSSCNAGGGELPLMSSVTAWEDRVRHWGRHLFRDRPTPRPGDVILFSNDYLALSRHPRVVGAQQQALAEHGTGMMMSGVFVLDSDPQRRFEEDMADFLQGPAVVACQSGWDANVGLLQALLGPQPEGHPVYVDLLAHASLWAGSNGTGCALHPFVHNDTGHLERLMAQHGPGTVCIDTLYSTTGDVAPLTEIVALCRRHGCALVADESHALGVHGPLGNGLAVELGLHEHIPFRTASLAKAFAGRAGIIACDQRVADWLPFHSLNAIYSSTLLPQDIAGLHAALHVIRTDDVRRKRLWTVTDRLHAALREVGCDTRPSAGPILPLHAGPDANLAEIQHHLDERGILGAAFLPPTTPRNRAIHRLTAHSELTDEQINRVAEACAGIAHLIRPRPQTRRTPKPT